MATKMNRAQRRQQQRKHHRSADAAAPLASAQSLPSQHALSSSRQSPAGNFELLERLDGFAFLRNKLREIARDRGDWAGIPMPLADERLVVEPRYPNAKALMAIGKEPDPDDDGGYKLVNRWYSRQRRCDILLFSDRAGRLDWGLEPAVHSLRYALGTLNCAEAWGIEQESNAVQTLAGLLNHRQFKQYMLTGMFIETSQRSKTAYLFRRLRPTVAIATDGDKTRILCALCMHPIAYYAGTWAGAMTPTDDVIAHLMLMRGDEAMFWRRCTQHQAHRPEAGL